jgi:hypothetical protein
MLMSPIKIVFLPTVYEWIESRSEGQRITEDEETLL